MVSNRGISLNGQSPLDEIILRGVYPEGTDIDLQGFYSERLQKLVARNLLKFSKINFDEIFGKIVNLVGQLFKLSNLSNELGINVSTFERLLFIFNKNHIVYTLQPYTTNINTTKQETVQKLYFYDTGLLCYMLGIKNVEQLLDNHIRYGHIFENFVINEVRKRLYDRGYKHSTCFMWDTQCNEVDLMISLKNHNQLIEIKSSHGHKPKGKEQLKHFNIKNAEKILVYQGEKSFEVDGIKVMPLKEFLKYFNQSLDIYR